MGLDRVAFDLLAETVDRILQLGLADDRPYMAITYFMGVTFETPGKYELRVFTNGEEVLRYPLYITQADPEVEAEG